MTKYNLLDKIINVTFKQVIGEDANGPVYGNPRYITCPEFGQKPTISVSGKFIPSPIVSDLELRITNFIIGATDDTALDTFKYAEIELGYASSLKTSIAGQILYAYQETPGPDGVTVFQFLIGQYKEWVNTKVSKSWNPGTPVNQILGDCAKLLGLSLTSTLPDTMKTSTQLYCTGYVKDFLGTLAAAYRVMVRPDGAFLIVCNNDDGTGVVHVIENVTTPPRRDASGYNLTAPFDPSIRPNDTVRIDSLFSRSSYGGSLVNKNATDFIAQVITFDFCTTDDTNHMIIMMTEKANG